MSLLIQPPEIPTCAWKRPIGKGWDKPYTVRYASNLDNRPLAWDAPGWIWSRLRWAIAEGRF